MELRQLSYFVKAAETLHFTEAAEAVFITQSTLSQQIKQLENELGMLLFDRVGKHVQLTEAGRVFLQHARRMLAEADKAKQAIADLNNLVAGELRIGITYVFSSLILPALSPFIHRYPGIKIYIEYGRPEELEKKLQQAQLDFILAFTHKTESEELEMQPLFTSRIVAVVSKRHALAKEKQTTLKQLATVDLALPGKGFISRIQIDELFRKNNIQPTVRLELNDVHSLLTLVKKENWATILNEKAVIGWDGLVVVPIEGKGLSNRSYVLWQKGVYRKKAAVLFVKSVFKLIQEQAP
jgi:LysR family cyn operon transcriptional activator